MLRVRDADLRCKTRCRYFTMMFESFDAAGEGHKDERFAELLDILEVDFEGTSKVFLKARWFKSAASRGIDCGIDLATETVRLRSDLQWEVTDDCMALAENIGCMVVLLPVPYGRPHRLVSLDRRFDTLDIPGGEEEG